MARLTQNVVLPPSSQLTNGMNKIIFIKCEKKISASVPTSWLRLHFTTTFSLQMVRMAHTIPNRLMDINMLYSLP